MIPSRKKKKSRTCISDGGQGTGVIKACQNGEFVMGKDEGEKREEGFPKQSS
jgi:hypothetical protein